MKEKLKPIGFMFLIAAFFGGATTALHLTSQPTVQRNRRLLEQRAYLEVFGMLDPERRTGAAEIAETVERQLNFEETVRDPETGEEIALIKAFSDPEQKELKGYAIRFAGMGVWGPVEGLLAVTPDLEHTMGLVIIAQAETPGLGGRIADPVFTEPFFDGLLVARPEEGDRFIIIGGMAPDHQESRRRHVEAITGATQTSLAMGRMINQRLRAFHRAMAARE